MRVLVVGAGAVGGYFGGRLAQAGRDVTFLVRARRAEELKERGLRIVSPYGDLTLDPAVVTTEQIAGPYDLILLGVKSYSLEDAMDSLAPAVGSGTMILPALNGMRHIDRLSMRFGKCVLGGVCLVAAEVGKDGTIRQLADFQKLIYGELDGPPTPRIEAVDATLRGAGFETAVSDHILRDLWQKWVQLASLGAVNCLLRGSIGQIVAIPGGADLCLTILGECAEIAKASGFAQSEAFLKQHGAALTANGVATTSSMFRDLRKGLPVEADTIVGDLLRRGQELGLKTPLLEAAFVNLSIYQRERLIAAS